MHGAALENDHFVATIKFAEAYGAVATVLELGPALSDETKAAYQATFADSTSVSGLLLM